jgi:hypothetical protein
MLVRYMDEDYHDLRILFADSLDSAERVWQKPVMRVLLQANNSRFLTEEEQEVRGVIFNLSATNGRGFTRQEVQSKVRSLPDCAQVTGLTYAADLHLFIVNFEQSKL